LKVSIITPSYNQGQFIERTLLSVVEQAKSDFTIEHIVFDGGSADGTLDILKGFNHEIRWVSEKDGGQTDAVNKGILAADGEIIGWLNSDDVYYPNAIARVVAYFTANPEVGVIYGMADHIDPDDNAFESYPTEPWDFGRLQETCFICQPAAFFRRSIIKQHGLLDDSLNYCMDYEFWLRLGKAGVRFTYVEEKFAGSRLYAENKTLGARVKVHKEINDMFKKFCGKVPDRWLFNYAHAVVERHASSRSVFPKSFYLGLRSIGAAYRWNHGISRTMLGQIKSWVRLTWPI
jgi:glycosyltransferase involved in cell wall biosynthesis